MATFADVLGVKLEDPKEVKPPAQDAISDEEVAKMGRKQQQAFVAMRHEIKELRSKVGTGTQNAASTDELQKKLDAAYDQLSLISLEHDPRFRQKYDQPRSVFIGQIKDILKEFEVDEAVAETAMRMRLKDRIPYLQEHAGDAAQALLGIYANIDTVTKQQQAELAQHQTVRKQYIDQQESQFKAQVAGTKAKFFDESIQELTKEGFFMFRQIPGQEQWNKLVSTLHGIAKQTFDGEGKQQAKAMVQSAAAPVLMKMWQKERADNEKLRKELGIKAKARPPIGAGGGSSDSGAQKARPKNAEDVARILSSKRL